MMWSVLFVLIGVASAMGVIVGINRFRHEHRVAREIRELLAVQPVPMKARPCLSLPPPVERYRQIAVRDHAPVRTLRLYHGGTFRPRRGSRAFPIRPALGAVSVVLLLGVYAMVFGVAMIAIAWSLRRLEHKMSGHPSNVTSPARASAA